MDVNEFGWVCGWVMECMEKGYLTEEQVGFRLTFGDAEGADALLGLEERDGLLAAEHLTEGFAEQMDGGREIQESASSWLYRGLRRCRRGRGR